ncbi:MAG TPA: hypothetical protein VLM89_10375, partial [Phycisphaerae bacterium]|nr:hypothetical protein [Phycisphaerae bacterium]
WSVFGAKEGLWDADLEARWQQAHGSAEAEHNATSAGLRAWQRTVGDERMGYLLFALALAGAACKRDRLTLGLIAMLTCQLIVWLLATHLFARFAVVFLLPLIVLAARAGDIARPPWPTVVGVLLVLGAGWNLYRLWGLYYHHTRVGSDLQPLQAYGQTPWFTEGSWPGTEPWGAINKLGSSARVMLVGEARTFYIHRPTEYAVAFSRHPLAEAVRYRRQPADVLERLTQSGTTHLLVHWGEIRRLTATYGMDAEITPALFERLRGAGLKSLRDFAYQEGASPYATLFEVPGP